MIWVSDLRILSLGLLCLWFGFAMHSFGFFLCGIRERARLDRHHHVLTTPDHDLGSAKGEAYNFSARKRCVKWVLWVGNWNWKMKEDWKPKEDLLCCAFVLMWEAREKKKRSGFLMGWNEGEEKKKRRKEPGHAGRKQLHHYV